MGVVLFNGSRENFRIFKILPETIHAFALHASVRLRVRCQHFIHVKQEQSLHETMKEIINFAAYRAETLRQKFGTNQADM